MPVSTPIKPFPSYKWRWATFAPSESLNEPPVYLGVLRVLSRHEGERPNSTALNHDLAIAEDDLRRTVGLSPDVSLGRDPDRNLLRNSQQYWKALGLLEGTRRGITLTNFGRRVASGGITQNEFAATAIKTLELPNRNLETDTTEWERARLTIKPLQLILEILTELHQRQGHDESYLTRYELVKVVIPLAGVKASVDTHVKAIMELRTGRLDISGWPDCAPESNDKRMAREFLLFLTNYGYCKLVPAHTADQERYYLETSALSVISDLSRVTLRTAEPAEAVDRIRSAGALSGTERRRILAEVLARPQQARFRKDVLNAAHNTCLFTGERVSEVLEAAHIIPVKHRGTDTAGNGLCLRADIHNLFDSKHLRIAPDSTVIWSEVAQSSPIYSALPHTITLPAYVGRDAIEWRWKYY